MAVFLYVYIYYQSYTKYRQTEKNTYITHKKLKTKGANYSTDK